MVFYILHFVLQHVKYYLACVTLKKHFIYKKRYTYFLGSQYNVIVQARNNFSLKWTTVEKLVNYIDL